MLTRDEKLREIKTFSWPKKHLTEKNHFDKQGTQWTQEEIGQVSYLEYCIV